MNPARSGATAMVSQYLSSLWIYLVAVAIGALMAVVGCRCVREQVVAQVAVSGQRL